MAMNRARNRKDRSLRVIRRGALLALPAALLVLGGCVSTSPPSTDPDAFKPQPVIDIERIQPFRLEQSFAFDWRQDRPQVRSGMLVVFEVDTALVVPRNVLEPVLYAGNQTVQRLNSGHESGFVIGIIPGQVDLATEPAWFGTPALPERIDAEMIARERAKARRANISVVSASDIENRTLDTVMASDLSTLLREQAADLVLEFSPQEKLLAESWRLPVTGN